MKNLSKYIVSQSKTLINAISILKKNNDLDKKFKILLVTEKKKIVGTITDGDIRRFLIKNKSLTNAKVHMAMNSKPIYFFENTSYETIKKQFPKELKKRKRSSKNYLEYFPIVNQKFEPIDIITYADLFDNLDNLGLNDRENVNIYGLGYVGLTFGLFLAEKKFNVHGYDNDYSKIQLLNKKRLYFYENGLNNIFEKNLNKSFFASKKVNKDSKIHIICVGTNIDNKKKIINKQLKSSLDTISQFIKKNSLVLIRSTVPVGYTESFICKILENKTKLKSGVDFYVANIPERTLAGNAIKELTYLPQILGGINNMSISKAEQFLKKANMDVIRVEDSKIAEIAKLANNSIRDLNFAFSNELARLCEKYNIDIYKTISASNLGYPRNKISQPSPGVGGSCLTKDPFLLSLSDQHKDNIFKTSRRYNDKFLKYQINRILKTLKKYKKINNLNTLICGLAFKGYPETSDIRNSTSLEFANRLKVTSKKIFIYDPVISKEEIVNNKFKFVKNIYNVRDIDLVLFMNNHPSFNKINIKYFISKLNQNPIIFDGWNIFDPSHFVGISRNIYMSLSQIKINE